MLTYINTGLRDYFTHPVRTFHRRVSCEFQAVIQGRIAPVFPGGQTTPFQEQTLWVFPRDSNHGWAGMNGEAAEILVFHFTYIPDELMHILEGKSTLKISLDQSSISLLKEIFQELSQEYLKIGELYSLKSRIAADRLSLLICSEHKELLNASSFSHGRSLVENAIALFTTEMHSGINVNDISNTLAVSPAHLRRLFHEQKGICPRTVMENLRMSRAAELTCFTNTSFLEIAHACGFSEQSSFSKAFSRYWNTSPSEARRTEQFHLRIRELKNQKHP